MDKTRRTPQAELQAELQGHAARASTCVEPPDEASRGVFCQADFYTASTRSSGAATVAVRESSVGQLG